MSSSQSIQLKSSRSFFHSVMFLRIDFVRRFSLWLQTDENTETKDFFITQPSIIFLRCRKQKAEMHRIQWIVSEGLCKYFLNSYMSCFFFFFNVYYLQSTYLSVTSISSTNCFSEILEERQARPCWGQHYISYSQGWPRKSVKLSCTTGVWFAKFI